MTALAPVSRARPLISASAPRTPRYTHAFRLLLVFGLTMLVLWGTPVVRCAAGAALLLGALADWEGATRHLLRLSALLVAACCAPWCALAAHRLLPAVGGAPWLTALLAAVLSAGAIILLGCWCGRRLARRLRRHAHLGAWDHMLGALIGTAAAGALVLCASWLLTSFEGPVRTLQARLPAQVDGPHRWALTHLAELSAAVRRDPTADWFVQRNPLQRMPAVQAAEMAAELAADPQRFLAAIEGGELNALAELPEVARYLHSFEQDPELREALRRHDVAAVANHPLVRQMLRDRDLYRALLANRAQIRAALGGVNTERAVHEARQLDESTRHQIRDLVRQADD